MAENLDSLIASDGWFDADRGLVDRRIFSDPDIYRLELERLFGRVWNFMCHESQVAEPGRFFLNRIGEDPVIVVRDRERRVRVLLNSCPHRGNSVCRAEEGKTRSFFCSYHGWNFDLDGTLLAVPGYDDFYRGGLDKSAWGLTPAAKVESYRGFVFATLDPDAPPLGEFLGWVGCLGLDMMAERGELEVLGGIQKNRIQCNWKLAVDNLFDWYHPKVSHGSAIRAGMLTEESLYPHKQMVLLGDYGHAIGGPGLSVAAQAALEARYAAQAPTVGVPQTLEERHEYANAWRQTEQAKAQLGPVGQRSRGHPNLFPNVWIASGGTQMCLRLPRGPLETELWWFTFVEKGMSEEARQSVVRHAVHFFGPAGLLEQDDGENWSHSTRGSLGVHNRSRPLNFSMGLGQDQVTDGGGGQSGIETVINEHGQRWTYRAWQEWLQSSSWADLEERRSHPPSGTV